MNSFYGNISPPATILDKNDYEFTRKNTNDTEKHMMYQPYTQYELMNSYENTNDEVNSHDNPTYLNDEPESTRM